MAAALVAHFFDRETWSKHSACHVRGVTVERLEPNVQVHHRGDRGVDGILRLIELAGHDGPLEAMLCAMCDELAAIAHVEIASIYVREGDRLVMRGNHGFAAQALGTALRIGEGLTGLAAECMRPVSAARASDEARYKHVPGLGEERFPVFAGIPLIGSAHGGRVIGVLVLQRRESPLTTAEVTLATALGAPATLAIERRLSSELRSARLAGRGHVVTVDPNVVLGRAAAVPSATALGAAPEDLDRVLARLRDDLSRAIRRVTPADGIDAPQGFPRRRDGSCRALAGDRFGSVAEPNPAVGAALDRFALALCDGRLRERFEEAARAPDGLRKVAKDYARAPYKLGTVAESREYVAELEELCVLVGENRALRAGAVWIADRAHSVVAIAAVARGAMALVAADYASPAAIAIARAAGLPLVSDVTGLFGWVRPGDLVAVDGSSGSVLVHPPATEVEALRRQSGTTNRAPR